MATYTHPGTRAGKILFFDDGDLSLDEQIEDAEGELEDIEEDAGRARKELEELKAKNTVGRRIVGTQFDPECYHSLLAEKIDKAITDAKAEQREADAMIADRGNEENQRFNGDFSVGYAKACRMLAMSIRLAKQS